MKSLLLRMTRSLLVHRTVPMASAKLQHRELILLRPSAGPLAFCVATVTVHSWCDLSCDYCYMYKMADQSWRNQPRWMTAETADLTAMRIGEHAISHSLRRVTITLHGGEPLLTSQNLAADWSRRPAQRSLPGDGSATSKRMWPDQTMPISSFSTNSATR